MAAAAVLLGGCRSALMDPQGPVGADEKTILFNALGIMLVIVVPTILATLLFAWWFRASNRRARYRPTFTYSGRIELVTWSIPILVVLFLGGLTWVSSHTLDPAEPLPSKTPAVNVQVVSLDWKWLFIYPDQGVASVNALVVPAGAPIHLKLTSSSVMNTFFVPQLGGMIYTMNGMAERSCSCGADQPGTYAGAIELTSAGTAFRTCISTSDRGSSRPALPPGLTMGTRRNEAVRRSTLAKLITNARASERWIVAPFTYRDVDPDLFQKIVTQALPPGPGPVDEVSPGASRRAGQ